MLQIKPYQLSRIINSNKDFVFFKLSKDNKVISYKLSNDYLTNYKSFDSYRIISTIKKQSEFITI